ncbi:MAG: hypothetical protein U0840_16600 [Gemmataceae bacterium]
MRSFLTTLALVLFALAPMAEARTAQPNVAEEVKPADELQITLKTEVMLNGRRVEYSEIPRTATITYIELAPDAKTVLKIYFRKN